MVVILDGYCVVVVVVGSAVVVVALAVVAASVMGGVGGDVGTSTVVYTVAS